MSDIIHAHNIKITGAVDKQPMVFAHGFGCDQNMWRFVAPAFEDDYRVILFDFVGAGGANRTYDPDRYRELSGYAEDIVEIFEVLDLREAVVVCHSVSCMIALLAAKQMESRIDRMVFVGPSPRYIDDVGYEGGFSQEDINELLHNLESNYLGWSSAIAPAIMGNPERPQLGHELTNSFCRMDLAIAKSFAEATFLSDNRADLPEHRIPTLVLQCSDDLIAGTQVGEYVSEQLPQGELIYLQAKGHCPHLSAPEETVAAIRHFL